MIERVSFIFQMDVDLIMLIYTAIKLFPPPPSLSHIKGLANTGVLHCRRLTFNLSRVLKNEAKGWPWLTSSSFLTT